MRPLGDPHSRSSRNVPVAFRASLRNRGVTPLATQFRSPNMNAYAERFIQTLEHECLDHFIVLSWRHMDYLVEEFLVHYHTERSHQSVGNLPLIRAGPMIDSNRQSVDEVECQTRLGGLLRHCSRKPRENPGIASIAQIETGSKSPTRWLHRPAIAAQTRLPQGVLWAELHCRPTGGDQVIQSRYARHRMTKYLYRTGPDLALSGRGCRVFRCSRTLSSAVASWSGPSYRDGQI